MSGEYNTFKYIPTLPEGLPIRTLASGGETVATHAWSERADITAGVVGLRDGEFDTIWTVHSRMALAEAKAKRLTKENTVAGRTFIAVPLNLQPRNQTYFSGYYFGNAEDITILDTSEWTMEMWARIRYNNGAQELAKHFAGGVHEFEEKETWRGSKRLTLPICKTCYLMREELYA